MKRFRTKKVAVVVIASALGLGIAGGALAYFTSSGSGTGHATVGTTTPFTVTPSNPTGPALLPGSGDDNIAYTVTNNDSGTENLSSTSVVVTDDGSGNVVNHLTGLGVPGCLTTWFTATNNAPTYGEIAGNATVSGGSVDVTMQDVNAIQDACKNVQPEVTISAS